MVEVQGSESCLYNCRKWVSNVGNRAIFFTFLIIFAGSILMFAIDRTPIIKIIGCYLLSIGFFALFGGVINWLAIQMLFYKIPLLYGSGILRRKYMDIKLAMREVILQLFFNPDSLRKYIPEKVFEAAAAGKIEEKVSMFLDTETGQALIDDKIDAIARSTEGQLLQSIGIDVWKYKPLVKPLLISYLSEIGPSLVNALLDSSGHEMDLMRLKDEMNRYMSDVMTEVSPRMVRDIMYRVILQYLQWSVLWGCVFGSVVGAVCEAVGLTPAYNEW